MVHRGGGELITVEESVPGKISHTCVLSHDQSVGKGTNLPPPPLIYLPVSTIENTQD